MSSYKLHPRVPVLIIEDVFGKEVNEAIMAEAVANQPFFQEAKVHSSSSTDGRIDKTIRSNHYCEYDTIYKDKREKSVLLESLRKMFFEDRVTREVMESSPYPLWQFDITNLSETQVSRYGTGDHYTWHIDKHSALRRLMTVTYYFNKEPRYEGGDIQFTLCPTHSGQLVDPEADIYNITPKNNMILVFPATISHRVTPTVASDDFEMGRFGVNWWIGIGTP